MTTTARTMTARYRGTCTSCAGPIRPGEEIRHEGRGLAYHPACPSDPDAVPTTPRSRGRGRRVTTFRTSGGTFYRNSAGRCIDAPCCGCCTI